MMPCPSSLETSWGGWRAGVMKRVKTVWMQQQEDRFDFVDFGADLVFLDGDGAAHVMLSYTDYSDIVDPTNLHKQSNGVPQYYAPQRIGDPNLDVGLVDVVGVSLERTLSHESERLAFCLISTTRPLKCLVYHSRGRAWRYGLTDDSADEILFPMGNTVYDDVVKLGMVNFWLQAESGRGRRHFRGVRSGDYALGRRRSAWKTMDSSSTVQSPISDWMEVDLTFCRDPMKTRRGRQSSTRHTSKTRRVCTASFFSCVAIILRSLSRCGGGTGRQYGTVRTDAPSNAAAFGWVTTGNSHGWELQDGSYYKASGRRVPVLAVGNEQTVDIYTTDNSVAASEAAITQTLPPSSMAYLGGWMRLQSASFRTTLAPECTATPRTWRSTAVIRKS